MFGDAGHKILHRARSLRRLRPDDAPAHQRGISISSDDSRASSSGSDTSRRGNSVEWDPLRLHPSMEVDRSPHITPLYHGPRPQQPQHHDEETHDGRTVEARQPFRHPPRHTHLGVGVTIYDGFDFGFDKTRPADGTPARRLRAPKSVSDLQAQPSKKEEEPQWNGLHSPARRHIPGGFDEADYFIKRGGWKRRGIVFGGGSTDAAHDSDEDCFDI